MPTDKLSEDKFDEMLGQALKGHSVAVPADFTNRMLRQLREAQEQKILARIVLQERLALAGCIIFGSVAIIAATVFPDIATVVFRSIVVSVTQQQKVLVDRIPQAIKAFRGDWQFYTILGAVSGFAVYSLVELFIGDRVTIT
ncbi:MAG: hypothetical protein ACE5NM_11470 [Sedimentisphaerales bacterium]